MRLLPAVQHHLPQVGRPSAEGLALGRGIVIRIAAFDPGTKNLGCVVLTVSPTRKLSLETANTYRGASAMHIYKFIGEDSYAPDALGALAVEDIRGPVVGAWRAGETNASSIASLLRCLGWVEGVAAAMTLPVILITPRVWRSCLGLPANATKLQARRAIERLLPNEFETPEGKRHRLTEHEIDACAIGYAASRVAGQMRSVGEKARRK